jgi:hypothetical protein
METDSKTAMIQLTDFSTGEYTSDKKTTPFHRFVFHIIDTNRKSFTFYIYQHKLKKFYKVYYQSFDSCLCHTGWSKTLQTAFHNQQNVINPRGMYNDYIAKFQVSPEIIQEMASQISIP